MSHQQSASAEIDHDDFVERWLTISEVVERTGYKRGLIYLETRNGNLKAVDRGGHGDKRWPLSGVIAWLKTGKSEAS